MSRFRTGLIVGKFSPLHLGHEHVVRAALAACEHVVLLSYSRPELPGCAPARRAAWLAARFPETTRLVLDNTIMPLPENHDTDDAHRAFCASVLRDRLGRPVDAIFTSETYGPGFAADLSRRQGHPVIHVAIDPARAAVPVSGTALRADIHGLRRFLAPEVYASFIERVAILGGESTGKSTLAAALAEELGTSYVAEYGRELWEIRNGQLAFDDLLAIAREQIRREESVLLHPRTTRFLFCDTTPLTTLFYSRKLFGRAAPELESLARRPYNATVLCGDDFAFVQDGTRRDDAFRRQGQRFYREQLASTSFFLASGPLSERLRQTTVHLTVRVCAA